MNFRTSARDRVVGRAVILTTACAATLALILDLSANSLSDASLLRSIFYVSLVGLGVAQLKYGTSLALTPVFIAAYFGIVSVLELVLGEALSLADPGTTLALLILAAVTFVGIRERESTAAVLGFAGYIAAYTLVTLWLADFTPTHAIGFGIIGTVAQALVLWIVFQLIASLARSSEMDARNARIQGALAECSQALLNRGTPEPLQTALHSLLDATDGHYAYVDVNRTDASGSISWEIVAEAASAAYPDGDPSFIAGTYDSMGDLVRTLQRGEPAEIITSQLEMPLRARYEKEGIKAELVAPIHIGSRWVGSLGYTDHIREGTWTRVEVEGLMRAAEMVGAFWEREAAREGLMELAQAKDRFIAAVSHELRTPLAAVVGFAGELAESLDRYGEDEVREITHMIYSQGMELTHLVDDLLTSERAASGNLTIKSSEISLLDECQEIVHSSIFDAEVAVTGANVTTHADSLRTRQIIRNLITNAVRYGGETILVEVSSEDLATVTVKDDGPGVKHLDVERIFDPYYRSQDGHSSVDSVGLGLAVARQLARLMGGDIVYRRVEGWTHFELSLPLASEPAKVS